MILLRLQSQRDSFRKTIFDNVNFALDFRRYTNDHFENVIRNSVFDIVTYVHMFISDSIDKRSL